VRNLLFAGAASDFSRKPLNGLLKNVRGMP